MRLFLPVLLLLPVFSYSSGYGEFLGTVKVEWIREAGEDRKMKLLDDFAYKDPGGKVWLAPKDWTVDGASIPRILWSTIGSPFTGDYREASVVHDYYCNVKTEPWQAVHEMFYQACLAGGVPELKAKTMFAAVYSAGPRWEKVKKAPDRSGVSQVITVTWEPTCSEDELGKIDKWIEADNPNLDDLKKKLDEVVKDK